MQNVLFCEHRPIDQKGVSVPQWRVWIDEDPNRPTLILPNVNAIDLMTLSKPETPNELNCRMANSERSIADT